MTRIMAVWTLSLLLLSGVASADPEPWMKRENPNELAVSTGADDECGFSDRKLRETVDGVLIRSRIKPLGLSESPGWFVLMVNVDCAQEVFRITIDFADEIDSDLTRLGLIGYGSYGVYAGESDYLLRAVTRRVELAITDYLKANFDL